MVATDTDRILALVDRQAAARQRTSNALATLLVRLWRAFTGYYSPQASQRFAEQAAMGVSAAQRQTAALTERYLIRVLELQGASLPERRVELPPSLRGVEPVEVYQRAVRDYRYHRSGGLADTEAKDRGRIRLLGLADLDATTAMREASRQVLDQADDRVVGYRRIIHPELSQGGTCGLCIAASDRIYRRGELLPVHARCKCDVLPIVGDFDPGRSLNAADLAELYGRAGGTEAAKLKRVRYQVQEHGELGPVLTEWGEHFRDAQDADARRRGDPRARTTPVATELIHHHLAVLEGNLTTLLARAQAGENLDAPVAYHRRTIALLQRRLTSAA